MRLATTGRSALGTAIDTDPSAARPYLAADDFQQALKTPRQWAAALGQESEFPPRAHHGCARRDTRARRAASRARRRLARRLPWPAGYQSRPKRAKFQWHTTIASRALIEAAERRLMAVDTMAPRAREIAHSPREMLSSR